MHFSLMMSSVVSPAGAEQEWARGWGGWWSVQGVVVTR